MDTKICFECKEEKPLEEFYGRIPEGKPNYYYSSYCKICDKAKSKRVNQKNGKKYRADRKHRINANPELKEKARLQRRQSNYRNMEAVMFRAARKRAKEKDMEFNIEVTDIVIPDKCPLLDIPFVQGIKGNYFYTPSLDRIYSSKGYVKVISMLANSMKNVANNDELLTFAKNIEKYLND
jgi:hypothetical protein